MMSHQTSPDDFDNTRNMPGSPITLSVTTVALNFTIFGRISFFEMV